jgi:hypothetical protein
VRAKQASGRRQPTAQGAITDDHDATLSRSIQAALEKNYLKGRRLVRVKIRQVEGNSIEGFLKIEETKGERLLVDFRATSTPQGGLSSLEVGGKKISVVVGAKTRGARD